MKINPETLFNSLSNELRLRSLMLMQADGELCVCELISVFNLSQPKVSRHLALLRENGLVSDRRAGQWVYYRINPKLEKWVLDILKITFQENMNNAPFRNDLRQLKSMNKRPGSNGCN